MAKKTTTPGAAPNRTPAEAAWLGRAMLRGVYAAWVGTCIVALALLIGIRWLRYTSWSELPSLDAFLRDAMVVDAQAFLWTWVYTNLKLDQFLLAFAIVVVCLHRRLLGTVATSDDGVWHLRRPLIALLLAGMVWLHWGFDMNPTIAKACAASIALLWLLERPRLATAAPMPVRLAVCALFLGAWILAAHDIVDRLALGFWAAMLLLSHAYASTRVRAGDLLLLRALAIIPMNVLPTALPLVVPMHGGHHLGDGLAYSFCEVPQHGTIYASLPVCDSVQANYENCRDGRVVEYDRKTLKAVAAHRVFSPEFHGRLELLVCLDDQVQVSIQGLVYRGEPLVQSAMAFSVANPEQFTPVFAGAGIGNSIAFDKANDAIFYSGEFNNRVVRYDRKTGQFDDRASAAFLRPWFHPFSLERQTGSLALFTDSIDAARNRIYLAEWMQGRDAFALDLTTLQPVARYGVGAGGAMGIAVDAERNRLFVSSLWGLEVFDLETGRAVARLRTGLRNRPVIVDRARNQLYLASMVEGKIRVLDRDTFELLDQLPIGLGARYAYLTLDGDTLLASSTAAHYSWDADALARPRSPAPSAAN